MMILLTYKSYSLLEEAVKLICLIEVTDVLLLKTLENSASSLVFQKNTNLRYGLINIIFAIGERVNWRLDTCISCYFKIVNITNWEDRKLYEIRSR